MLDLRGGFITLLGIGVLGCVTFGKPYYSNVLIARGGHSIVQIVLSPNVIFETEYWRVILSDDQKYLGRSIIYLKRPAADLADLSQDELNDWHFMLRILESAMRQAFDARLFNWGCLMNHAYRIKPYTPLVHWHMRPRYDHSVYFSGVEFRDEEFGSHYETGPDVTISNKARQEVINEIRKFLPLS